MITKPESKKTVNEEEINNGSVSNENQESKKWYQLLNFQNLEMNQANEYIDDSNVEEIEAESLNSFKKIEKT